VGETVTPTELELEALDVLDGDPEAMAQFADLLREFMTDVAELIAYHKGVPFPNEFVDEVLKELDT
jgi:hypothetical protein